MIKEVRKKLKSLNSIRYDRMLRKERFSKGKEESFEEEMISNIEKSNYYKNKINRLEKKLNATIILFKELDKDSFDKTKDWNKVNDYAKARMEYLVKKKKRFEDLFSRLEIEKKRKGIAEIDEFVLENAREGSKLFTYQQIIEALSSDGMRGLEIYGWLEINNPDKWEMLLRNGVLDKMAYFSRKNYSPEIIKVMSEFDIKKYVQSPVLFAEEIKLESLPDRPFKRAVFYAEKPLREYIKWLNNYVLYIEGYKTKVVLGKVNLILLGWALPDFPQILVSFSPSQNQAIYNAQIKSEDLRNDTLDLLKKMIFYYRRENKVNEMKVIEYAIERDRFEKKWSNLLDKMDLDKDDDPQKVQKEPKIIYSTNPIFYVVFVVMGVIISILIILLFMR